MKKYLQFLYYDDAELIINRLGLRHVRLHTILIALNWWIGVSAYGIMLF